MRKLYNFKRVMLVVAAMMACSISFAQFTETQATATGADKNTDAVGISYTLPGTYIAGKGSTQAGTMTSKGLKLRTKQEGGKIVFNVNKGYTIVKLVIDAVGNYVADDNTQPYVKVTGVNVDGATVVFDGGEFPEKGSETSGILTVENINAKEQIEILLNNDNASAGTQINACYEVTYEEAQAAEPVITLTPTAVNLIPGATYQIKSTVVPGSFMSDCMWYAGTINDFMNAMSDGQEPTNDYVSVDQTGLVTALAPGQVEVKLTWLNNPGVNEDTTLVTIHNFKAAEHAVAHSYDFTTMGDVTLSIGGESMQIWNDANNQCNGDQFCTNEGLQLLAFQAVITDSNAKGWKIVDGQGLQLSGAGRSAAIGGLKAGQYVEFVFTGSKFATRDYTEDTKLGPDVSTAKQAINEGEGHIIYQVKDKDGETDNLVIGFEINQGEYIKSITVYEEAADPTGIRTVSETAADGNGAAYNLMGIKVAGGAKGLLVKDGKKYLAK